MRKAVSFLLLAIVIPLTLFGCGQGLSISPTATSQISPPISVSPKVIIASPTSTLTLTPIPKGKNIVVSSAADSGPDTLRQALLDAENGDIIIFDDKIFPPTNPITIYVTSELPLISQGNITVDASNAGVILNGSNIPAGGWEAGLQMVSDGNTIRGMQVVNFSGTGIAVSNGHHNIIGGDRNIGLGPLGQGNLTSGNDIGIGLWGDDASHNLATGNLIGTYPDEIEPWMNRSGGVLIIEGANHNTIGPGNTIANNGVGIEIHDSNSFGNLISQNSIHNNGWMGIFLWAGGNRELAAPVILNSDLNAGTVTGTACASCTVEIFSDAGGEGGKYEGQTSTDISGIFIFKINSSLVGSRLTGVTIDAGNNTSAFSILTNGEIIPSPLQNENNIPTNVLQIKQSRDLEDNRIGTLTSPDLVPQKSYDRFLNAYWVNLGLKRMHLSFNEIEVPVDWEKPELTIDPIDDNWVTSMINQGMTLTYVLTFWDKEYQATGGEVPCPRFKTEEQVQRYLEYVRFIVNQFKDRIQYFEIWNEPNSRACPQWIEVEDYINLVRRTVPVIRQEFPNAKVVVGGTTGLNDPASQNYLFSVLNSDLMPMVDIVTWHPFYGSSPQYKDEREYYYGYPSLVQKIKDVATKSGFAGDYWADEMTWRTPLNAMADQPWTYSETVAAKYYGRSIVMHLALDIAAGVMPDVRGTIIDSVIRNLSTLMAGANPLDFPVVIQTEAENITSYGFSLPNGDKLLALWTNGTAVEDDPGINTTLTFPNLSAVEFTGIDVLHSFEQPIIAENVDGNVVVRELLVKDYPIILRLKDTSSY